MNKTYLVIFLIGFSACGFSACSGQKGESPQTQNQNSTTTVSTPTPQDEKTQSVEDDTYAHEQKILDPKDIGTPMEAVKELDKNVEAYHLGQNLTPEQLAENQKLKSQIIRGTFDIKELCRLALAKHWDEITDDQRRHFVKLMTNLLDKKALFSKEQLKGENKYYKISYLKDVYDDAEKKKATVTTKMFIPKDKIDLDLTYKMLLTPYGWKIFDVIVDDASLLSNYRFQFDRIIQKGGFEDLIKRMEVKLVDIK